MGFATAAVGLRAQDLAGGASLHGPLASPRIEIALKSGWQFKLGDTTPDEIPGKETAGWTSVNVPHTWNRVGFYKNDIFPHINTEQNVVTTQGVGSYKLVFTPPAELAGMESFLQFDAASRIATVWLNGTKLGTHAGGFSRFRFDATSALKPGGPNLLTVEVDNTRPAVGTPTADVLPLAGDFFVYGGLYRPVSLIATNKKHIDMMDYGSSGIYATTTSVDGNKAQLNIRVKLKSESDPGANLTLHAQLQNAAGKVVAETRQTVTLAPSDVLERAVSLIVNHPHLWQGTEDPYLYKLSVDLADGTRSLDAVSMPFGIRQVHFDPNKGLFLNGKHVAVHGVGYHQDREGKGWASDPSDVAGDVEIMREMGVTGVRLTHYQHGQPIHDLADRAGLVLWDEIPLVSAWTLGGAKEATAALRANAEQQMHEEIAQDFNHPSVVTWSIGNEVDFGNTLQAYVGTRDASGNRAAAPDPLPLLRDLNAEAHTLDPSRPTTLATCCEGRLFAPNTEVPITASVTDLSGANRYFGWYYGKPSDFGPHLDSLHKTRPSQPQAVTEYGAGGALSLHSDDALGGPESRNRPQAEEYESYIHEQNWATIKSKPYLWGSFLWNSFDFGSDHRMEGDAQDMNTKGIVTYDRKVKKDPYYFYKANWTDNPTVHVNSSRYTERAYAVTSVHVYSNAPKTRLRVNGTLVGTLDQCPERICIWNDVRLQPGTNKVVAEGVFAKGTTKDQVSWHLSEEAAKHLRIDCGALVGAPIDGKRFGSDTFFRGGTAEEISAPPTSNPPATDPAARLRRPAKPKITGLGVRDVDNAASYRSGSFEYRIPLRKGKHSVTLIFVEPSAGPGERIFKVTANGTDVLSKLDIAAVTGQPLTALKRQFDIEVTSGVLELRFQPLKGDAIVSSIQVE